MGKKIAREREGVFGGRRMVNGDCDKERALVVLINLKVNKRTITVFYDICKDIKSRYGEIYVELSFRGKICVIISTIPIC
jgi:hypothetical protein